MIVVVVVWPRSVVSGVFSFWYYGLVMHTSFYQGSRVRLVLNDKSVVIGKYKGHRKGKSIELDCGTFRIVDIRAANYYKPLAHER